jgi:hypothetical protein
MCIAGLLDAMRSSLPAGARIVWMCLENHADRETRKWRMSLDHIVAEVNLSIEAVVRAVRLLEAQGIIRGQRDGPGRNATTWHMLRSYVESPQNEGIKAPKKPRKKRGLTRQETPQNEGIEKAAIPAKSGVSTPQSAGISRFPPHTPPFLTHQNPPEGETLCVSVPTAAAPAREAAKDTHTLPPDWEPSAKTIQRLLNLGLSCDEVGTEAERFRGWALGGNHRKADWENFFVAFVLDSPRGRRQQAATAVIRKAVGSLLIPNIDPEEEPRTGRLRLVQ